MRLTERLMIMTAAVVIGAMAAACSGGDSPATPTAVSPALATAAANANFALAAPTFFPTSADRLTQAQTDDVSPGIVLLTYIGTEQTAVAGTPRASAVLFITETKGASEQPATGGGRLVNKDASGYELHEGPDQQAGTAGYRAVGNGRTLVMIFRGEKPTDEGVEELLASLEVVK